MVSSCFWAKTLADLKASTSPTQVLLLISACRAPKNTCSAAQEPVWSRLNTSAVRSQSGKGCICADRKPLTPVSFTSRFLVLLTSSSGLGIFGLCLRRRVGTRRVRGTPSGVLLGNAPARCDSDSTARAASSSQRRALARRCKTLSVRRTGILRSRFTGRRVSTSHKVTSVYHKRTSAEPS